MEKVCNSRKGMKRPPFSEEWKMAIKASIKKLWENPEYRKHMSEVHKGKKFSKDTKRKMSKTRTGRKHSEEWDKNISKAKQGSKHPMWKGGKITNYGYFLILNPEHPFCNSMGYVREHRLVMEKHLGRYLTPEEVVHHKGIEYPIGSVENKQDNRIENLLLFSNGGEHIKHHIKLRRLANASATH